jgi:hypothetical protein
MRGGVTVSHDSGFRRGGQDYTHRPPKRSPMWTNRAGRYDRNAEQRFRQHEREHQADSGETPAD